MLISRSTIAGAADWVNGGDTGGALNAWEDGNANGTVDRGLDGLDGGMTTGDTSHACRM